MEDEMEPIVWKTYPLSPFKKINNSSTKFLISRKF
jgi:hypothetical protein